MADLRLTHLPLMPHICVNWAIIGSGNGLSPIRHQAITRTNACLLSIGLLGTNFSKTWIEILPFPFMKMHLNMSSDKMAAILPRGDEFIQYLMSQGTWTKYKPVKGGVAYDIVPYWLRYNAKTHWYMLDACYNIIFKCSFIIDKA